MAIFRPYGLNFLCRSKHFYQKRKTYDICIFYHENFAQFEIASCDQRNKVEKPRLYIGSNTVMDIIRGNLSPDAKESTSPDTLMESVPSEILKRLSLRNDKVFFHLLPGDIVVKQYFLDVPCATGLDPVSVKWQVGSNYTRYVHHIFYSTWLAWLDGYSSCWLYNMCCCCFGILVHRPQLESRMEDRLRRAMVLRPLFCAQARRHTVATSSLSSAQIRWIQAGRKVVARNMVEKTRETLSSR